MQQRLHLAVCGDHLTKRSLQIGVWKEKAGRKESIGYNYKDFNRYWRSAGFAPSWHWEWFRCTKGVFSDDSEYATSVIHLLWTCATCMSIVYNYVPASEFASSLLWRISQLQLCSLSFFRSCSEFASNMLWLGLHLSIRPGLWSEYVCS